MSTNTAIEATFLKKYAKQDFSKITVKALCAETPVARTTFYAHYQNTDEVLRAIEDKLIGGLRSVAAAVSGGDMQTMDFDHFLDETMAYVKAHWNAFSALLVAQPDRRFEDKLKAAIKLHFAMRYPGKKRAANYELITEIMASAVLGGYRYWLSHPKEMQPNGFKRIIIQTLDQFAKILR